MKFACAAWPVERHASWDGYAAKLQYWVGSAARNGAELLVFPEYAGLEPGLCGSLPSDVDWLEQGHRALAGNLELHVELAARHNVHIIMGSGPVQTAQGYVNRANLVAPDGRISHQDKQILTPWERGHTGLVPGAPLAVFETDLGRIALLICYDSEFPLLAHALDADLLVVPSCTDGVAGANRIRIAAMARALEGARIVATSATIGAVRSCPFLDENSGRTGVYAPADTGFSHNGVLSETGWNQPGWVYGTVDPVALRAARARAQVDVPAHWDEQDRAVRAATLRRPHTMKP